MKKFFKTILLFLSPFIGLAIIDGFLPATTLAFRGWEALRYKSIYSHSAFYSYIKVHIDAVGDLCHHTPQALPKNECWITDALGFRNDNFIEQPDVIIVGDSFVAGSSLHQKETITNLVKAQINDQVTIYNFAPSTLSELDYYMRNGIIKKPRLIIFSNIERSVPPSFVILHENSFNQITDQLLELTHSKEFFDKAFKFATLKWIKARLNHVHGNGIQSPVNPSMYFYQGKDQSHTHEDVVNTFKAIYSYQHYCDSLGIQFMFLPMPDKETVYYELVPFKQQSPYLLSLDSLLQQANIHSINTLAIYNEYRKHNTELLYHLDDTHWNANATRLMAKEIVSFIKQDSQLRTCIEPHPNSSKALTKN